MPVTIPPKVRRRRYAMRALALVLLVSAGFALVLRSDSFGIRMLALGAIVVGVQLVKYSDDYVRRSQGRTGDGWSPARGDRRVGPLAWTLVVASLVACGVFYFAMYVDALHGGKQGWPVIAFAGAGVALTFTSGYIVVKLSQ